MALICLGLTWLAACLLLSGCAHHTDLTIADIHLYTGQGNGLLPAFPDSLVCISYNIEFSQRLDQALDDLVADPRLQHPDILLLQEMDAPDVVYIAEHLGLNYVYYPSFIHSHHGRLFGTAVLSPWPLHNPQYQVLPHANPMTDKHRVAVAVDVQIGSRSVRAVSVHLSTLIVGLDDRLEQAAILRDSLASVPGPVIIGGDFNSGTSRESVLFRRVVRRTGFKEARLAASRTALGGPLDLVGHDLKLDHIYYRNLEVVSTGVSETATASDHFPIWSVFRWQD